MNNLHFSLITGFVAGFLTFGALPAFAIVDLAAFLPIDGGQVTPNFHFLKTIILDYPNGGKLKEALDGKNVTVVFSDNSTNNPSIKSFMEQINAELAIDRKSTATFTNLRVDYQVMIQGNDKQASIDYLLRLTPTLTGYTLSKGDFNTPTVFDMSWIGFTVKDPVTISTLKYGELEINFPLDVIKSQLPDAYYVLKGTRAESLLNQNLIDASPLVSKPIDKWDTLFDPYFEVGYLVAPGYARAKVSVTTFSSGQSETQIAPAVLNIDSDFTGDVKYHLTTVERASTGTINVEGHANAYFVQGYPAISTTLANATRMEPPFPIGVLSTMAVIVTAIVIGIYFWRKTR